MSFNRIFGIARASNHVVEVTIEVDSPDEASITDMQLQGGHSLFQWGPNVGDLDLVQDPKWTFANGIVSPDQPTLVLSDVERASPFYGRLSPNAPQVVRWGGVLFGTMTDPVVIDGHGHTTTRGAGLAPYLTAHADQLVDLETTGVLNVVVGFRGISVEPGPPVTTDDGTVLYAHTTWDDALAVHATWADLVSAHTNWS